MQPLTSSRSSPEAVSWEMCVPATLQPDEAWKRPAHTGPSLVEAPVGLQSPYCTRPPRCVQKQERKRKEIQSTNQAHPCQDSRCVWTSCLGERRGRQAISSLTKVLSISAISIAIQSKAIPAKNRRRTCNRKTDFKEEQKQSAVVKEEQGVKKKKNRQQRYQLTSKNGLFQLGSAFSHACLGVNGYTNRARQRLSEGQTHSSAN